MSGFNEDKAAAQLAEVLALECGVHPVAARQIRTAAYLHDIGKQKLSEVLLNKPGKLTASEFEVIKTHTRLGAEMLIPIQGSLGNMARLSALYHHEHWDGGGYFGKRTDELPAYISYISIADVFTALVSERSYKSAWPPEEAIKYINNQAGTQFSPALVRVFVPLAQGDSRVRAIYGEVM